VPLSLSVATYCNVKYPRHMQLIRMILDRGGPGKRSILLEAGRWWVRTLMGAWDFSLLHTRPDWHWGPPSLFYKEYGGSCPRVQRPRRVVDHPPPSSDEVMNRSSYSSAPSLCLHGMLQGEPCL